MSELDKFLEERSKIPIPSGEVAKVKLLAKELALGVHRELWHNWLQTVTMNEFDSQFHNYFCTRWVNSNVERKLELLRAHGYATAINSGYVLTESAFNLLDEVEPYNVFTSYRRHDSSALALLVLARLKEHSLVPFVDMALEAGGNWHADLEERIEKCDYFIILLGKETLSSPVTLKEIDWSLKYVKSIIPIWHSGFDIGDEKWKELPAEVMNSIQQTNAIRVTDESASGYNTAIVELLNRFGITP